MAGVEPERRRTLIDAGGAPDGRYVLYWMQASQRAQHNPALEAAVERANHHGVPLVVMAVVIPEYPDASARHFAFMLGGLGRALHEIRRRGLRHCLRVGDPVDAVTELARDAAELVLDRGYLRHQRRWYRELCGRLDLPVVQVEGDVVVPIDLVSDDHETGARTIRPKIAEHRDRFIVGLDTVAIDDTTTPQRTTSDIDIDELTDADDVVDVVRRLGLDQDPGPVDGWTPGTDAARARFRRFLDHVGTGAGYDGTRNRYGDGLGCSQMSPYLHYGQVSPVQLALDARSALTGDGLDAFLEELVVRRELAVNHVFHEPDYDRYAGLPEWARTSLEEHRDDEREHRYTASELEAGETHDDVWNAIMDSIRRDGWVHNQLRMYWGKQIVEWTNTPEHAFATLLDLNNRYFLDGRDANSFANVGWCFGLHDRGFKERDVSGKLRPFTTAALQRKDDLEAWLDDHG